MAAKFVIGKGSSFSVSIDGGNTFIPVGQSKTINYTGQKQDFDDVTNMDSIGNYHEVAPTLLDPGQAALQGVFDPMDAGQLALRAAFTNQTLLTCKHVFPKGSDQTVSGFTRIFSAYVSDTPLDAQFDKASTYSTTLKITGPIPDAQGS